MSKKIDKVEEVKTESVESVVTETIKGEEPAKVEKMANPTKGVELMAVAKKIGVVRYLQDHPQKPYIETLMKKKYAMKVKTIPEWDKIAEDLAKVKY